MDQKTRTRPDDMEKTMMVPINALQRSAKALLAAVRPPYAIVAADWFCMIPLYQVRCARYAVKTIAPYGIPGTRYDTFRVKAGKRLQIRPVSRS